MKIRKAKKEDLKEISEIFRIESNKKPYLQGWTKKMAFNNIYQSFKKDKIYVAFVNEKVVGFIIISLNEKKDIYVDELWIKQKCQKKGIGKFLMKFIEEKYKEKGSKLIKLSADKKADAVKFYKKLNYKTEREYVRILMTKKL